MGAATLTGNVAHHVLSEPSLGTTYPLGSLEDIEAPIAAGDLDAAAVAVLTLVGMSAQDIDMLRSSQNLVGPRASHQRGPCHGRPGSRSHGATNPASSTGSTRRR
jgi:hypothetical protein